MRCHLQLTETGDAQQHLMAYLREKHLLLILDNFEHILDAVPLVNQILAIQSGEAVGHLARDVKFAR